MKENEKDDLEKDFSLEVVSIRLVKDAPLFSKTKINGPWDAVDAVAELLTEMDREVVCVINLKNDNTPINCHIASVGAINHSVAHPRELLKASILSNAASMIIVHNHPSGNLTPSKGDANLTDRMLKLSELIGITLLDHIIVGGDNSKYFSFKAKGMLDNNNVSYKDDYEKIDFPEISMVADRGRSR